MLKLHLNYVMIVAWIRLNKSLQRYMIKLVVIILETMKVYHFLWSVNVYNKPTAHCAVSLCTYADHFRHGLHTLLAGQDI